MNVLINTLSITPTQGGTKTYLTNLIKSLIKIDNKNRYILLCSKINKHLFNSFNCEIETLSLTTNNVLTRIWYDQYHIASYTKRFQQALLFNPLNIASLYSSIPQVTVIHGSFAIKSCRLQVPSHMKTISFTRKVYYDLLMPVSLRKTNFIITVSENFAKYIIDRYPFVKEKLRVVKEGVDLEKFFPLANPLPPTTMNDTPYILFVSSLFPYKNADKLIYAFAKLHKEQKISNQIRLKLAGKDPDGKQLPKLKHLSLQLGIASQVDFLGGVPHEKVVALYQNAITFVYPSSVESFGLPVLEAMACGTPVIAANKMSLPEIVGDAGIVVEPDNIEALANSIYQLIHDTLLRNQFIEKGLNRVKNFTWEQSAVQTLELFNKIREIKNYS
jgi:glycosyltransferase involved in cell wall biosynthesis